MPKSVKRNRVSRWIERKNHEACLVIARTYYQNRERGRRVPVFKPRLLAAIAQRCICIFVLLFRFDNAPYVNYRNRSFRAFSKRLLGVNKFEIRSLLPFPTDFTAFAFPTPAEVEVSIVICAHNHIGYTYNCLLSVLQHTRDVRYEVIVVNDGSTDDTAAVLATLGNLRVIDNEQNIGFLRSCNRGARVAKGQYICLLNNDVQVQPDWLAYMLAPFDRFHDTGLVGAKLVYPYGLLQEAGGIVNAEGEPANYGKFEDPDDVLYNYLRETDYCSGACIALPKRDFLQSGGFDEQFSPAYYEDTDLAFRVRYWLKKKVYYQPLARVVHFEGVSSGKVSDGSNVKSYQRVNAAKFREKWQQVFETFPRTADHKAIARKFLADRKSILVVEPLLPTFDQDSGSRRMFELLKLFLELNWNVIFSPEAKTQEEPYYSTLVNMGVWVLNKPAFHKRSARVIRQVAPWVDVAWICRPHMNRRYGPLVKQWGIRWINDTVDIHFLREERASKMECIRPRQARKIARRKQRELSLLRQADTVIAITPTEAELLEGLGIRNIRVVPNVHYPVAVELPGFGNRHGICFIGGYRHLPNVDAARWLIDEIMPMVWEKLPAVNVYLLGSLPPEPVTALRSDRVHVPGYLPDVAPYFLSTRVFAAPLRFGAGMKGKIGQSFEFGLPVVTTDIGAEGMALTANRHYLRANTAAEFAEAIVGLYDDEALWTELSKGALTALTPYSPEKVKHKLKAILDTPALD